MLTRCVPVMPACVGWLCSLALPGLLQGVTNTSTLPHLLMALASFPVKAGQDHSTRLSFQNRPPVWSPLPLPGLPPLLQIL